MENFTGGGLTLAMFNYAHNSDDICLDEKLDKHLFEPDGILIAYIISNFYVKYHPDYQHLSKEFIEENKQKFKEYNNNRGRKKKEKVKKNKKPNSGTNTQFGSCIVFGVIAGPKVHGVKVFRKSSGNISKLTHTEISSPTYIPELLNRLFDYINSVKPVGIRYVKHETTLANITDKYALPDKHIIQLYLLRKRLDYGKYNAEFWDCDNVMFNYNGRVNHLVISLYKAAADRITSIEICPEGNIHIYGGKDILISLGYLNLAKQILDEHSDIIIAGVRASEKSKPRPDFSTFKVPTK